MHEQLKAYLIEWRVLLHLKEAVTISSSVSKLLSKALRDPHRIANAPAVPDRLLKPQELPLQGLLRVAPPLENPTSATLRESQASPHVMAGMNPVLTVSVAGPMMQHHVLTPPPSTPQTTSDFLARQRVVTHILNSKPAKKGRKC